MAKRLRQKNPKKTFTAKQIGINEDDSDDDMYFADFIIDETDDGVFLEADEELETNSAKKPKKNLEKESKEKDLKERLEIEPEVNPEEKPNIDLGLKPEEQSIIKRKPENITMEGSNGTKTQKKDESELKGNFNKEDTKKDTQEDTKKDTKEDTQVSKIKQDKNTEIEVGVKLEENPIKEREHKPENGAIDEIEENKKDKKDELESKENLNKEDTEDDMEEDDIENDTEEEDMEELTGNIVFCKQK